MKELKTMKVNELKNIARAMEIKGWWDMKKTQLIEAIENHRQTEPLVVDEPIEEVVSEAHEEEKTEEHVNTSVNEENATESVSDDEEAAQKKNKKRLLTYNGKTQTLTAWSKELGIRHQTLYNRIVMKGWDVETAFETPLKKGVKVNVEEVKAQ